MNQKGKNDFKASKVSKEAKYGIISTQWNKFVVDVMLENAEHELISQGVDPKNIKKIEVPGSYELPIAAQKMLEKNLDAVIALGAVIKGETPHFNFISKTTIEAIMKLSIESKKPIGNGILTCINIDQANARSEHRGLKRKGREAAVAMLSVLSSKT